MSVLHTQKPKNTMKKNEGKILAVLLTIAESGYPIPTQEQIEHSISLADPWQRYSFEESGFSINFISKPEIKDSGMGSYMDSELFIRYRSFALVPGDFMFYGVRYLQHASESLSREEFLSIYKTILEAERGDSVVYSHEMQSGGQEVVRYKITGEKKYIGKIISVGNRIYDINAECFYCEEIPEFENFVNSFKFITDKTEISSEAKSEEIEVSKETLVSGDIKIQVPKGSYSYNSFMTFGSKEYIKDIMNVLYFSNRGASSKSVVTITKLLEDKYEETVAKFNLKDYNLEDESYLIAGENGQLYTGKIGTKKEGGMIILLPVNTTTLYVKSPEYTGITKQELDQMLQSIEL